MRYEINADDTVANPVEFADVPGNDGLKTDCAGQRVLDVGRGAR